ncbi:ABC transporter ATP-binding protein [Kineococcus gynurae]|uniref:ABC transporter ATP-binding protein n=1 Tax=Kineococcus gynurae TaxID=452979 RepID=A0ABV5LNS8_9ACTN
MDSTREELAVEVADLERRYRLGRAPNGTARWTTAVAGVSFTVRRGEVFGLLGTNGAGKTSTIDVVAGLARADAGTVRVLGEDPVRGRRTIRPRIGTVLQSGGLPGGLTVAEAGAMWAGTLTAPRPLTDILQVVGLTHRLDVAVASLSGGERRRLDVGLALLGEPDLLLLDEPTTGLDAESRRRIWDLIRGLVATGTAVLLTTHHLEEAEELSDRLAIMHAGRIAAEGTVAEIVADHDAEIRWGVSAGAPPPELLGHDCVAVDDRHVTVRTTTLQRSLSTVLTWAAAQDLVLPELRATPASLETAFLDVARSENENPMEVAA